MPTQPQPPIISPTELPQPTMYDLPSEDPEEPGLPDEFHWLQPSLLRHTIRLQDYPKERIFTCSNLNIYYDVNHTLWHKRPDWFLVVDVPRLYEGRDLRDSYVIWQEKVNPVVVIELLSPGTEKEDLGERADIEEEDGENGQAISKANPPLKAEIQPTKWEVYEQILQVPYYLVYSRRRDRLRLFKLEKGKYQEQALAPEELGFWLTDLKIGIGIWLGEYEGINRRWLRWYDETGNWLPTAAELVIHQETQSARAEAQQAGVEAEIRIEQIRIEVNQAKIEIERANSEAQQERQKRQELFQKFSTLSPEQLIALGINLGDFQD